VGGKSPYTVLGKNITDQSIIRLTNDNGYYSASKKFTSHLQVVQCDSTGAGKSSIVAAPLLFGS